jgi:hypothetical protein
MNIKYDIFSSVFKGETEFNGNLDIQDAGNADPIALMRQTGYLTVRKRKESDKESELYLAVPNNEVGRTIMRNCVDTCVIPSISPADDNFKPERWKEFCNVFYKGNPTAPKCCSKVSSAPSRIRCILKWNRSITCSCCPYSGCQASKPNLNAERLLGLSIL